MAPAINITLLERGVKYNLVDEAIMFCNWRRMSIKDTL